ECTRRDVLPRPTRYAQAPRQLAREPHPASVARAICSRGPKPQCQVRFLGHALRRQVPRVRRSSVDSEGPRRESRRTNTPPTTGTAATEPSVWTSAVRASSGAMPTSSRVGAPAGVRSAGAKEMVPRPCSATCRVLPQTVMTPGVPGTSERMQSEPMPGANQYLPATITGIRCANAGFMPAAVAVGSGPKPAGSPSGRVRSSANEWRCMRDSRPSMRGACSTVRERGFAPSGLAEPHDARPAPTSKMRSELAQMRQLTVLFAITAVLSERSFLDHDASANCTVVLFGELPMIRGVRKAADPTSHSAQNAAPAEHPPLAISL